MTFNGKVYLDKCANDDHNDLCNGPVLHVTEVCLDHVKVPGLGALGHLLKLSDDLRRNYIRIHFQNISELTINKPELSGRRSSV